MISRITAAMMILLLSTAAQAADKKINVLSTTYPIWLLTKTVVQGDSGVNLDILLSPTLGCPHDYSVTPRDLTRMAAADVIVINGLGMDDSIVKGQDRASGTKALIIDSSKGISGTMNYLHGGKHASGPTDHETGHAHHGHDGHFGDDGHHDCPHYAEHHGHDQANRAHPGHVHEGVNPHLFASPAMAARIVRNIADAMSTARPEGRVIYQKNAAAFETRMEKLVADFRTSVKKLKNPRIVTQHGAFDYLAKDVGLQIVAFVQDHPGYEPSAAEMLALVSGIRSTGAGAIFVEPQYPQKVPRALARETGIPVGLLDPLATGPAGADIDLYERVMRQNIAVLEKTLGTR